MAVIARPVFDDNGYEISTEIIEIEDDVVSDIIGLAIRIVNHSLPDGEIDFETLLELEELLLANELIDSSND